MFPLATSICIPGALLVIEVVIFHLILEPRLVSNIKFSNSYPKIRQEIIEQYAQFITSIVRCWHHDIVDLLLVVPLAGK